MVDDQSVFNILIEQELDKQGIKLNNYNYPIINPDSEIIKCYENEIKLSEKSCSKIAVFLKSEVEFYDKAYNAKEEGCDLVGTKKIELFRPINNNLQINIDKNNNYISIHGNDYKLDDIYIKYTEPKEFNINNCKWPTDEKLYGNFKGCFSRLNKNDKDIINNKYIYSQYNIVNETPIFDYLYYLGDGTYENSNLKNSKIYNNKKITDTFKCIYNCSTQNTMDFVEKTDKDELEKKNKTSENIEWYNLIHQNNCNIIGLTNDLNYKHKEHLYNQFNLFINDVMEYLVNYDPNKSNDKLKQSFKNIFISEDNKFYSHVIKSFLVPYLLKDFNTINLIPKFSGLLYFGKTDISTISNQFINQYYVPKTCSYKYTDENDIIHYETKVFSNDNSYNSVLYSYKYENYKFVQLNNIEFKDFIKKDNKGNYIYSNLMKDVDESKIFKTNNYDHTIYSNRTYYQNLNYTIYEPIINEHHNSVNIYEANKCGIEFNNKQEWYYNPEGRYNQCSTTKPGEHDNETCEVNDTIFYTKMKTQSCGVNGINILGNKYESKDIYNQEGQKIKKIGSSDDKYSVIIAKEDINDIPNSPLLKIGNEIKVKYGNIDCGKSFSNCLSKNYAGFDMRIHCKNSNYLNKCTFHDEENALIQPYAIGDYITYLRYLYFNDNNYDLPCVNKEIHYNDIYSGVGDNDEYMSYDYYKRLFKIDYYNNEYIINAINKAEPYYLLKHCSYTGKYLLNNKMTNKIQNAIIENNTLWCKYDEIDNDIYHPLKYIDYSTLTYVIDDRYLYILYYLFDHFTDELVTRLINDIIQLVYENPNMYIVQKLKGLYFNKSNDYNKSNKSEQYYFSMENPFNNISLYSDDSTIVPNNFVKTEFPKVKNINVEKCEIDDNHKIKYNVDPNEYNINNKLDNNLDKMFKNIGSNYLNIVTDKIAYPRLSIKNDTSALDLLYNSKLYYILDTTYEEDFNDKNKSDEWNTKGFVFKPDFNISNDKTKTNNYNLLTNTTLPFILYHYYKPNGFVPKFEFKYSSLIDNIKIWYKEEDQNNTISLGSNSFYVDVDLNTHQKIISNKVNNTEFYKYTYLPSCLMPNNSKLNYLYSSNY